MDELKPGVEAAISIHQVLEAELLPAGNGVVYLLGFDNQQGLNIRVSQGLDGHLVWSSECTKEFPITHLPKENQLEENECHEDGTEDLGVKSPNPNYVDNPVNPNILRAKSRRVRGQKNEVLNKKTRIDAEKREIDAALEKLQTIENEIEKNLADQAPKDLESPEDYKKRKREEQEQQKKAKEEAKYFADKSYIEEIDEKILEEIFNRNKNNEPNDWKDSSMELYLLENPYPTHDEWWAEATCNIRKRWKKLSKIESLFQSGCPHTIQKIVDGEIDLPEHEMLSFCKLAGLTFKVKKATLESKASELKNLLNTIAINVDELIKDYKKLQPDIDEVRWPQPSIK